MGSGGARRGAGRPPGPLTKKTREIAVKAMEEGLSPLECLLANMRYFQTEAVAADKLLASTVIEGNTDPDDLREFLLAQAKQSLGFRMLASKNAEMAAGYMHPHMSPLDSKARTDHFVPLAERVEYYLRRDTIAASEGKVVALPKPKRK